MNDGICFVRREPAHADDDIQALVALYRAGAISPLIPMRCTLAHSSEALTALMQRKLVGKAVVLPSAEST